MHIYIYSKTMHLEKTERFIIWDGGSINHCHHMILVLHFLEEISLILHDQ